MSETKRTAKAAAKPAARFTVEALRNDSLKVLGIEQSTFDGAFAGCAPSDMFTMDEAKARLNAWLKKPVKVRR